MVLLIPLFFLITAIIFYIFRNNSIQDSAIKSFLVTFLIILLSTEILSLFNKITYTWILATWVLVLSLAVFLLAFNWRHLKNRIPKRTLDGPENQKSSKKSFMIFCGIIIAIIGLVTLLIAIKSPPNNFDSMTYHMARIPHWIKNQNVNYYPTAIPRQNYSLPLAEFAILHTQLLSKSDHYANLVQWVSFILSILLTTQIAKELKASLRGQWITGTLAATLPMAILQSTSTQNDLVVGIFCLSFVYFMLKVVKELNWENIFFASLSMGFALATKGTAYVYCAAIGLSIGGLYLIGTKWGKIKEFTIRFVLIIIIALLLNTGIYLRNWGLYRNPIFTSNERTISEEITPSTTFSNLVRNGAVHLATPVQASNKFLTRSISRLLGSEINNPASTFQRSEFEISFYISDDNSGNLLHFILLTGAIVIIPFLKFDDKKGVIIFFVSIVLSILLFSLAFKWQPWGSRLQTPIFLLGSILIALLVDKIFPKQIIPSGLIVLFFLISIPYLLMNTIRPLLPLWEDDTVFYDTAIERTIYTSVGNFVKRYPAMEDYLHSFTSLFYEGRSVLHTKRRELYFLGNIEPFYQYMEVGHYLRNDPAREIGLIMDSNDWEYPLWVLIGQHASEGKWQLFHLAVENVSGTIPTNHNPHPELILITRSEYQDLEFLSAYEQIYSSPSIQIMKRIE